MMDGGGAFGAPSDPLKVSSSMCQTSANYGADSSGMYVVGSSQTGQQQPPPAPPVRMSHAATNTPSANASSLMTTTAPTTPPNHRRQFDAATATTGLPPLVAQPKRRGPKVGSRRNQTGQPKWRLPNAESTKRRSVKTADLASHDAPNDPYAFHCDTMKTPGSAYEQTVTSTGQRNDHRQFGPNHLQTTQFGQQPITDLNQRNQNINHHHHHHHQDANQSSLRRTEATSSATRPINSCDSGETNQAIFNNIQNTYPYKNRNDQLNNNNHYYQHSSSSDKLLPREEIHTHNSNHLIFENPPDRQRQQYNSHEEVERRSTGQLGNCVEDMIAHKPQGQPPPPMQPAGVNGASPNVGQMQRQQQPQPPLHQMVQHHHAKPPQNIGQHSQQRLDDQANYYSANEQYTSEQQLYQDHHHHHHHLQQQVPPQPHHHNNHHPHTAPNNARFAPGRPQQHQHKQQMQQQYHLQQQQQQQPQHQQPLQQAQPQVPPHQLPYQPGAYAVDHTHQASGFASTGVEPVVGLHTSRQRNAGQVSGRPQQQQQQPLPPYANQQQPPVSVRPNNQVQNNRILNRQPQQPPPLPPQQQQLYKHNQQPPQNPQIQQHHSTSIPHHHQQQQQQQQQHHVSTSGYASQHNSGSYQAHPANQSTAFMSDPMVEQYSSSSPTLLQQQLNRQRSAPPTQPVPTGQPIQRAMPFGPMGPTKPRQQMIGGPAAPPLQQQHAPPPSSQQGGRFCGVVEAQVQEIPLVDSYVDQAAPPPPPAPAGHQMGRQMMANNGGPYNQPMNHRIQPQPQQAQRAASMRQPAAMQQQQQQPTMDNHLLGNPTPPLTPNAPNGPHLRQNGNMTGPEDWPQQSQHDHLHPPGGAYHNGPVNGHPAQVPQPMPPVMQHQRQPPPQPPPVAVAPALHQAPQRVGMIPKAATSTSNVQYHHQSSSQHHQPSMIPLEPQAQQVAGPPVGRANYQAGATPTTDLATAQARLTLPLRDALLSGPFRLEHDRQFTSKVFHIKPELFDTLSKSMNLANHQTAAVVQELQFRAYLVNPNNNNNGSNSNSSPKSNEHSLLASNHQHHHYNHTNQSGGGVVGGKSCNWPDMFQISVNQQQVHLDRSKQAHRPVDVFQFCQLGDNVLEIQVNDCYCNHEFVLEAVDRPTLRAFMNSCFKSRLTPQEVCVQKLKCNFGSPGFCVQNAQLQAAGIHNEYISEYNHQQGMEQTRAKVSLRCPISARRMRTPTRGHNCKHLQCFDLEDFLYSNKERSQWSCPICSVHIPFTMLELDQHQMNILQSMSSQLDTDDILIDSNGQWQAYYQAQGVVGAGPSHQHNQHHQHQSTAKSTGTFHPQPPFNGAGTASPHKPHQSLIGSNVPAARQTPTGAPAPASPASWEPNTSHGSPLVHQTSESPMAGPVRRPMSAAMSPQVATGRRSANGSPLAKRPYAGQYASPQPQMGPSPALAVSQQQASLGGSNPTDDLSPLALMERTIIEHEMGPPPFTDPSNLTSNPLRAAPGPHLHSPVAAEQQQQQQQVIAESRPAPSGAVFSPASSSHHAGSSPAARQTSTMHQQQAPPQSPMQQQHNSMPATPSSTVLLHGGPETPATPSNSMQQQQQQVMGQSPHINSTNGAVNTPQQPATGVDHQPLSNGSASAGSITSTSTMTPSGQSLGSVGMGGDSRCNTAPLQGNPSLDDLISPGGSNATSSGQYAHHKNLGINDGASGMSHLDVKNEILMNELMMDSNDKTSMLLGEAEWKQQLGKSEIVANFLTNSSQQTHLNKKHHHHLNQFQHHQLDEGANKMLSGGLNPSDDDDDQANHSNGSSPGGHELDQLGHFANYLGAGEADDGAGLPPDDNILDLFER